MGYCTYVRILVPIMAHTSCPRYCLQYPYQACVVIVAVPVISIKPFCSSSFCHRQRDVFLPSKPFRQLFDSIEVRRNLTAAKYEIFEEALHTANGRIKLQTYKTVRTMLWNDLIAHFFPLRSIVYLRGYSDPRP